MLDRYFKVNKLSPQSRTIGEICIGVTFMLKRAATWLVCGTLAVSVSARSGTCGTLKPPSGTLQTWQVDNRLAGVRRQIQEAVEKGAAPSIAVAVAVEGKIIWEEGFGWADRERRIPATPHTRYPIASVTKPFTATALMILAERGLVDLNRPVNQYLDKNAQLTGYAGDPSAATVRHLLQHRSGLPSPHAQFFYEDERYTKPSMEENIRRYGILVNPAGERWNYSNFGYGILERIIERLSGKSYESFLRSEIFSPLGLDRTTIRPVKNETAIIYDDKRTPIPFYDFGHRGASDVVSSVHDVVRFGMFHLKEHLPDQKPILKDATIDQMVNDHHTTGSVGSRYGTDWFYGLGWGGRDKSEYGYRWYGHEGGMPGVSAQLKLFPEKRMAIAVLSNGRQGLTYSLIDTIADALLPDYPEMRKKDPVNGPRARPMSFAPASELLGEWSGEIKTWSGTVPVTMTFQADADIHIKIGDGMKTLVNDVRFESGRFSGGCYGTIPAPDTTLYPHQLWLDLTFRGTSLSGAAIAATTGGRFHYHLPSWIRLTKQQPAPLD